MARAQLLAPGLMPGKKGAPPWYISLPGTGVSGINLGTEASIDNLHDAAFTVEGWFRQQVNQPDTSVVFMDKGYFAGVGWLVYFSGTGNIAGNVKCATVNAALTGSGQAIRDFVWHHLAACFDDAGDRKIYYAIDGTWGAGVQVAGQGAVGADGAQNLCVGTRATSADWKFNGYFGWLRISNNIRYTPGVNFTPAARAALPANDANTVRLFWVNEGAGATLTDKSTNAQNATVTTGTWGRG